VLAAHAAGVRRKFKFPRADHKDLLSDTVVSIVAQALEAHCQDVEQGALLSIDEAGTRVRLLPLHRSQDPP
jgi:hypothetical protein